MSLDKIFDCKSEWLKGDGPENDIVMSSRIRLARNLAGIPFPHRGDSNVINDVLDKVFSAIEKTGFFKNGLMVKMSDLNEIDKQILVERHLISKEHLQKNYATGVAISENQDISIMVNEEDHLRIQVLKSGFKLNECWDLIDKLDTALEKQLDFAYSSSFGYLTVCPTNVGTGMRASVMLHLPGLVMMDLINKVMQAVIKLGLTVRGFYGEGSEVLGNLFQVSNQVTLGKSEKEIISNIHRVIELVVEHERNSRKMLCQKNKELVKDKIGRAFGILANAHIISSKETISLLSILRMGMDTGLLADCDPVNINELFILSQPAHLQKQSGQLLDPESRDVKRADLIRQRLRKTDN